VNPAPLSLSEVLGIDDRNTACWIDKLSIMFVGVRVAMSMAGGVLVLVRMGVAVRRHLDIGWAS